jgi:hypothetical protein
VTTGVFVVPGVDFTSHFSVLLEGAHVKHGYLHQIRLVSGGQDNHFSFLRSLVHET